VANQVERVKNNAGQSDGSDEESNEDAQNEVQEPQ
jgi:hypothetical protein